MVSERLPGADCHQQQGPAWRRIIALVHESMFGILSEIAWQRVFEETVEQGWREIRTWLEKDTLVI